MADMCGMGSMGNVNGILYSDFMYVLCIPSTAHSCSYVHVFC